MITPKDVLREANKVTEQLIRVGLSETQNFPTLEQTATAKYKIGYAGLHDLSIVLKNIPYKKLYKELDIARNYNIKMVDGALLQMMYVFENKKISCHRLAFFPSPFLENFQNEPQMYILDEIYADIIAKNIIPFPIRFDFDPDKHIEMEHPKCHLTLGQFSNCRIPVAFPLTPCVFISFILRNFYNTAFKKFTEDLDLPITLLEETITEKEKRILHMSLT